MSVQSTVTFILYGCLAIVAWLLVKKTSRHLVGFDEIEWRGEKFKLRKKYLNYDDYKHGSNQIADAEVDRVKNAIMSISVPTVARSEQELRRALKDLRFPGYGSSHNSATDDSGNIYRVNEYEIPGRRERRTLLYRVDRDGSCVKMVDGISVDHDNDHQLQTTVPKVENGVLRHYLNGKPYREIALSIQ